MKKFDTNYETRIRTALNLYTVWCIVALAMTLYAGTKDSVLTVSMSAMGNQSRASYAFFIAWTIVFCSYFGSLTGFILVLAQRSRSRIRAFVLIAVGIMIFGDISPFIPDVHPILAFVHNTCAQISSLSLAFSMLLLALTIRKAYPDVYRRAIIWVIVVWFFLLVALSLIGTKALTEMGAIFGGSLYLLFLARQIAGQKHFSASAALSASDAEEAEDEARKLDRRARELYEDYLQALEKARQAQSAAEYLRRIERKHRNKTASG